MKKLTLFIFICGIISNSYSQEHVLSSGNDTSSSGGSVSYSVGLIHIEEHSGTGGSVSSGSQIAYEVLTLSDADVHQNISINVHPNPTDSYIYINLKQQSDLQYKLLDISGRTIFSGNLKQLQTKIQLNLLNASVYILNIYNAQITLKSYKIIKQ